MKTQNLKSSFFYQWIFFFNQTSFFILNIPNFFHLNQRVFFLQSTFFFETQVYLWFKLMIRVFICSNFYSLSKESCTNKGERIAKKSLIHIIPFSSFVFFFFSYTHSLSLNFCSPLFSISKGKKKKTCVTTRLWKREKKKKNLKKQGSWCGKSIHF